LCGGCSDEKLDSNESDYFTRIMVTEVTHEIDTIGHYKGSFEGIASDTGFLPKPEFKIPKAEPQIATVISNTDPEGQGRVQVDSTGKPMIQRILSE
jgi:uncharacterized protein involved in type VI secretion and phage assembly